ncbi:MAG: hypothetical protein H0X33_07285 [Taibaiella sp.]|nr:hypothetical protein [Taibaiella sp.]
MKYILLILLTALSHAAIAQHKISKAESALIIKKVQSMKEYKDEVKKVPALTKANNSVAVIIRVEIDATDMNSDEPVPLNKPNEITVYINEDRSTATVTAYKITMDRKTKKVLSVNNELDGVDVSIDSGL